MSQVDAPAPDQPTPDGPELIHGAPTSRSRGQLVVHPTRDAYPAVVRGLADDGYHMCTDLTAVDYLLVAPAARGLPAGVVPERFEVVTNLLDHRARRRIRLRVQVPESDPRVASLFPIFPGTESTEREVFDMFGITFDGHPDLTRILMPEEWIGHPLRKDYAVGQIPVQFKGAPSSR